jgi:hypothetical protein
VALLFGEAGFFVRLDLCQDELASFGHEDGATFLGEDGWAAGRGWLGWVWFPGGVVRIEEALEFGVEADRGEFVGHRDVDVSVAGVFDARAEIAGRCDVTGWGADDTGEEGVDFAEFQGDAGGAGFLDRFDAVSDGFAAQETGAASGGGPAVFHAVDIRVGLGGVSARSDFAGEGFVLGVGEGFGRQISLAHMRCVGWQMGRCRMQVSGCRMRDAGCGPGGEWRTAGEKRKKIKIRIKIKIKDCARGGGDGRGMRGDRGGDS